MALEMKVPSPGESITEVEIAQWLVEDGDYIEKDQPIAEVDSDKATLEIPAEASGIITLKAEEGDAVEVGAVICLIDTEAEKPSGGSDAASEEKDTQEEASEEKEEDKKAEKTSEEDKTEEKDTSEEGKESEKEEKSTSKKASDKEAETSESKEKGEEKEQDSSHLRGNDYAKGTPSPAAKKILDEKGMDPQSVSGSGRDGRITKEDAVKATPSMGTPTGGNRGETRSKLSMLRRKVAERLVSAKNETAMLTTFNEVDMSAIFELRKKFKEEFKEKHGVSLGFMSFFTLA
ncbi:MAG TPA: biotin/lipoyl-containing protein, partial [Salinimicrobium sp.]|nr:biotin/lipoyl-containing protein [Salinimicrobium sp.]